MLTFDKTPARPVQDGATVAVLLHGRGSHRGDLQGLGSLLPDDWALVTPQAPHQGHQWGYGPGWAWYRYVANNRVEEPGLKASLTALDAFLAELPVLLGTTPGRVVLGGFSQGGTVSMAYALSRPGAVSAVLNFSGFLVESAELPTENAPASTPVFWGHGIRDPNITHALAQVGRERLTAAGVPLVARDYPIGHWIDPAEVADAVAFTEGTAAPGGSAAL